MKDTVLAIDVGFGASGMALFRVTKGGLELLNVECVREEEDKKKQHMYVAELDVDRTSRSVRRILDFIKKFDVTHLVVELPSSGSKNGRASRCMGIATGMITAIVEALGLVVEWYTPTEVKRAATGKVSASKDEMMDAMGKLYPYIVDIPKVDREHIADACACMHAANSNNLVRQIRANL